MVENIFNIIGGLALFLYGLHLMSGGFKKFAGQKLKSILAKLTSNPVKGAGLGAFITMMIQSSSIMVVTLIGLLNGGLLTLKQAIGVMLGAEIGTTVTAQLVAFRVGLYALPIVALGFVMHLFTKKKLLIYAGQILLGFGILFIGMTFMSQGVRPIGRLPMFENMLASFGQYTALGVLAGAVFTGMIQSSSAAIGLIIAMGLEGVVALPAAISLMLGANIGTCFTGFLASFSSSLNAKRLSMSHFMTNVIGVVALLPFIQPFSRLVEMTSPTLSRQIANAHTMFNVAVVLVILPFVGLLQHLVKKVLPGEPVEIDRGVKYLDEKILATPSLAIYQAQRETERMANIAVDMLQDAKDLLFKHDPRLCELIEEQESCVDELHHLIDNFLTRISTMDLSESESQKVSLLLHSVTDIERVADHAYNLMELSDYQKDHKIKFSEEAQKELNQMYELSMDSFKHSVMALVQGDKDVARKVLSLEREVNVMDELLQENHYQRLKQGICDPAAGPTYLEIVHNLERVSDHSENIASGVLTGF